MAFTPIVAIIEWGASICQAAAFLQIRTIMRRVHNDINDAHIKGHFRLEPIGGLPIYGHLPLGLKRHSVTVARAILVPILSPFLAGLFIP